MNEEKHEASTCPACGYCHHCGRGGQRTYPYWPQPYPVYPRPYWTTPQVWPNQWTTISNTSGSSIASQNINSSEVLS